MSKNVDFLNSLNEITFEAIEESAKEHDFSEEQVQELVDNVLAKRLNRLEANGRQSWVRRGA